MTQNRQGVKDINLSIPLRFTGNIQWRHIGSSQVLGVVIRRVRNESHCILKRQQGIEDIDGFVSVDIAGHSFEDDIALDGAAATCLVGGGNDNRVLLESREGKLLLESTVSSGFQVASASNLTS